MVHTILVWRVEVSVGLRIVSRVMLPPRSSGPDDVTLTVEDMVASVEEMIR
jgi:hypothetical protein